MLAALIPAVTELASGYLSNRKEKAVAKQKLAAAKIEAQVAETQRRATIAEKKATGDNDWEQVAIKNTATSWKDEFALVVLMAPAIAV